MKRMFDMVVDPLVSVVFGAISIDYARYYVSLLACAAFGTSALKYLIFFTACFFTGKDIFPRDVNLYCRVYQTFHRLDHPLHPVRLRDKLRSETSYLHRFRRRLVVGIPNAHNAYSSSKCRV